jgi:hypothetical protein
VETAKYLLLIPLDKLTTHSISNKDDKMLTQEIIKSIFIYNPETGIFTNKTNRANNKVKANSIATYKSSHGYLLISLNYKSYHAHRIAWLYITGESPKYIDHINGIKTDNRICNLRPATNQQNSFNSKIRNDNASGYKGVHFNKINNNWRARACLNGKFISLGSFLIKEDAAKAYNEFSNKHHKEFSRPNILPS